LLGSLSLRSASPQLWLVQPISRYQQLRLLVGQRLPSLFVAGQDVHGERWPLFGGLEN